jgi:protein required for attachment to host cells
MGASYEYPYTRQVLNLNPYPDNMSLSRVKNDDSDHLLPNGPTYIVVGDSADIRIFESHSRFGDWSEIAALSNPDATSPERERVSDRPGRAFDSFGKARHAMEPAETARQHEVRRFAHQVGEYLSSALAAGKFEHLAIVVEPRFLGYLRKELSATTQRTVHCEIPLNTTGYDMQKLKTLFE